MCKQKQGLCITENYMPSDNFATQTPKPVLTDMLRKRVNWKYRFLSELKLTFKGWQLI